jgi:hypothetical protein
MNYITLLVTKILNLSDHKDYDGLNMYIEWMAKV